MITKTIAFPASQIFKAHGAFEKVTDVTTEYCPIWCADITIATVTGSLDKFSPFEKSYFYNVIEEGKYNASN